MPKQRLYIGRCQRNCRRAIAERCSPLAQFRMCADVQLKYACIAFAVIGNRWQYIQRICSCAVVNEEAG